MFWPTVLRACKVAVLVLPAFKISEAWTAAAPKVAVAPLTVKTPVVVTPPTPAVKVPTLAVLVTVKAVPAALKALAPVKALATAPLWV